MPPTRCTTRRTRSAASGSAVDQLKQTADKLISQNRTLRRHLARPEARTNVGSAVTTVTRGLPSLTRRDERAAPARAHAAAKPSKPVSAEVQHMRPAALAKVSQVQAAKKAQS
jgi:hypothetical protein